MNLLERLRARWRTHRTVARADRGPLETAADSLRALLDDPATPREVREALAEDYAQVRALLEKLERGELHIAVFGRVSVGKSALLNALLGRDAFEVGVLHGTTTGTRGERWREIADAGVHLVDTPGIDEAGGEAREQLALEVAARSDLVIFVVDGDAAETELAAMAALADAPRPMLLALNKSDRYTSDERELLLARLRERAAAWIRPEHVVAIAAQPRPRRVVRIDAAGREVERDEARGADLAPLVEAMVAILQRDGRTLAALNAAVFAGRLSDAVGTRIAGLRADVAERVIGHYCLAKGVAVGLNPVPVADLIAAMGLDVGLVVHLSRVYGLPMSRTEAGQLLWTISTTLAATMGAVWGTHLVASALKGVSAGLSTALTAAAQGAMAWYATLLVGRAAQRYLAQGKSWGPHGPKQAVADLVAGIDRDSVLADARVAILARLRRGR